MKTVSYSKQAVRTLTRMPANQSKLIRSKITAYAADPSSLAGQVKRLRGRPGYRLRVGNWRIIFDDDGSVLAILNIGPRGSVYG